MGNELKQVGIAFIVITGIGFIGATMSAGYDEIDRSGWIQHHQNTPVSWQDGANWIVGELRICTLLTPPGLLSCPGKNGTISFDDQIHNIPVNYWGRINRKETYVRWQCQRSESSLTCKAID